MKIETRLNFGDHFYYHDVTTVMPHRDFVRCGKCEGKGYFLGTQGQQHKCRACDRSSYDRYPFLPSGYVLDPDPKPMACRPAFVIRIFRADVWSINVTPVGDGNYQVSYVYDSDYDGDSAMPEDRAWESWEEALADAHKQIAEYPHLYSHYGELRGVLFETEI